MNDITSPEGRLTLSPAEAAAWLGVSRTTMTRWLRSGTVPSIKVAGTRLIRVADLLALVAGRMVDLPSAPSASEAA